MQLFNRMHKKSPSNIASSTGGRAAGSKWGMAGQAPAGNEAKKVRSYYTILWSITRVFTSNMSPSNAFKIIMFLFEMLMLLCANYLCKEELNYVPIRDLFLLTRLAIKGYILVLFKNFDHSKEHGKFLLNGT